jgi:hypothetical protein
VPAIPGPAADDADDELIVPNLATVPFDKLHIVITSLVENMGRFTQTSSTADHLSDLHDRVSVDEASLLEHRSKLLTF